MAIRRHLKRFAKARRAYRKNKTYENALALQIAERRYKEAWHAMFKVVK